MDGLSPDVHPWIIFPHLSTATVPQKNQRCSGLLQEASRKPKLRIQRSQMLLRMWHDRNMAWYDHLLSRTGQDYKTTKHDETRHALTAWMDDWLLLGDTRSSTLHTPSWAFATSIDDLKSKMHCSIYFNLLKHACHVKKTHQIPWFSVNL